MDCSLPGSSVNGTLQARILEWVAIPLSRGSSPLRDQPPRSSIAGISCIAGEFFTTEPPETPSFIKSQAGWPLGGAVEDHQIINWAWDQTTSLLLWNFNYSII